MPSHLKRYYQCWNIFVLACTSEIAVVIRVVSRTVACERLEARLNSFPARATPHLCHKPQMECVVFDASSYLACPSFLAPRCDRTAAKVYKLRSMLTFTSQCHSQILDCPSHPRQCLRRPSFSCPCARRSRSQFALGSTTPSATCSRSETG